MGGLDGDWDVKPLPLVRKRIAGARGETRLGPLRAGFDVVGLELRYRGLFTGIVDVLEPEGDAFRLRGTYRGLTFGRFRLVRAK
jgi:hypothetical protein